jgi:hypothetical protein
MGNLKKFSKFFWELNKALLWIGFKSNYFNVTKFLKKILSVFVTSNRSTLQIYFIRNFVKFIFNNDINIFNKLYLIKARTV